MDAKDDAMNFEQTRLPDQPLFRAAFNVGWEKYPEMFDGNRELAASQYLRGPVAMARLIFGHGGELHQLPAAACLAGPAAFCDTPAPQLNTRLVQFVNEIRTATAVGIFAAIPESSGSARLFCQASAILTLDQVADVHTSNRMTDNDRRQSYETATKIYSAARGDHDIYGLDSRFEVAMRKAMETLAHAEAPLKPSQCFVRPIAAA